VRQVVEAGCDAVDAAEGEGGEQGADRGDRQVGDLLA